MRKALLVSLATLCCLLAALTVYSMLGPRVVLYRLEHADPEAEAAKALSNGDRRLLGVNGLQRYAPGVSDPLLSIRPPMGMRVIPFTSDVIANDTERRLQDVATDYAARYNQRLLRGIGIR